MERSRLSARKCFRICPMCRGKGYFDDAAGGNSLRVETPTQAEDKSDVTSRGVTSLPKIRGVSRVALGTTMSSPMLPDRMFPRSLMLKNNKPRTSKEHKLPSLQRIRQLGSDTSLNSELSDFLHEERELGDIREAVKLAKLKLKDTDWDIVMLGLEEIVRASIVDKDALDWEMTGQAMTRLVDAFSVQKSRVIRLACQILRELFKNMPTIHRPQFDDVVNELIKKTADTSRMVRWDAEQALDSMVAHVPLHHAARAILSQAPRHKNPVVRFTAMRLVENIINTTSAEVIFTHQAMRESRRQILTALCSLIDDQNQDVRWTVRRILQVVMKTENFEECLNTEVEPQILKKADRSLVVLQYDKERDAEALSK